MEEEILLDSAWGTPEEGKPSAAGLRRERLRGLVRRSVLILPVNVPRFVEKAHTRGADAIMLDLEDSVPLGAKEAARATFREAMGLCARGGADILVRINKPYALAMEDLEACVWPGLAAVHFPKAESAREVRTLDELIGGLEEERGMPVGGIQLSIAVETALGLHNALAIAVASPRIVSIGLGPEDFTLDIEVQPSKGGQELFYGKAQMVVVARLAGVQPHGIMASIADYRDLEAFTAAARLAHQMGFMGSGCIHPDQVPVLNACFSPSLEDVAAARRAMEAFEGRASVGVEGKMVDIPVVERARRILARAEAIEAKEAKKRAALAAMGGILYSENWTGGTC